MNRQQIAELLAPLDLEQLTNLGAITLYAINDKTTLEHQWNRSKRRKSFPFELSDLNHLAIEDLFMLALAIPLQLEPKITLSVWLK
jgi:hypothetical protein